MKNLNLKKYKTNLAARQKEKGGAMIIVLITATLLAIFSVVNMKQFKNSFLEQTVSKRIGSVQNLENEIKILLSDKRYCKISFNDPAVAPQTFLKSNNDEDHEGISTSLWLSNQDGSNRTTLVFEENGQYGNLTIESIKLIMNNTVNSPVSIGDNYPPSTGQHADTGEVQIKISKKISSQHKTKITLKFDLRVIMTTDASGNSTIESCSLFNKTIDYFQLCSSSNKFFIINGAPYCQQSLGDPTYIRYVGGHGGNTHIDQCPEGTAAIGLQIHSGWYIDAVGLICKEINYTNLTSIGERIDRPKFGSGGSERETLCPEGLFVTGLRRSTALTGFFPVFFRVLSSLKINCGRYIKNNGQSISNSSYNFLSSSPTNLAEKCQHQIENATEDYKVALVKLCNKYVNGGLSLTEQEGSLERYIPMTGIDPNAPTQAVLSCDQQQIELDNTRSNYDSARNIRDNPTGHTQTEIDDALQTISDFEANLDQYTLAQNNHSGACSPLPPDVPNQGGDNCSSGTVLREIYIRAGMFIDGMSAMCW